MTTVKVGLIQMALKGETSASPDAIRERMIEAHTPLIEQAAREGVQVLCFQEIFTQPYFCPSQDAKWYAAAEPVPDGPTVRLMQDFAKEHAMVIVVPMYEEDMTGVYYNTAAVIDGRWRVPRQVPQDAHPADRRLLREILLQAGKQRLAGVRYRLPQAGRLHLL